MDNSSDTPFKFEISHIKGSENVAADCLSKMFDAENEVDPPLLTTFF